MRRWMYSMIFILLSLSGCSRLVQITTFPLVIEDLTKPFDGWVQKLSKGMSIEETEEALECSFPDDPYGSGDWNDNTQDPQKNRDDSWITFTVYKGKMPVQISYVDTIGHLLCTFSESGLIGFTIVFSDLTDTRDRKMTYGGKKTDLDALFEELLTDLRKQDIQEKQTAPWLYVFDPDADTRIWLDRTKDNPHVVRLSLRYLEEGEA